MKATPQSHAQLTSIIDSVVESYSHGMRQKLIISSAFVHRPDVIVVDEPMVGLDPRGGAMAMLVAAEMAEYLVKHP